MAKKKHDVLQKEKVNFIDGCVKNGVDKQVANDLFTEISTFSSYAFNKAHATAYSIVSYRTAYLKCHYPSQYMAALITSVLDRASKVQEYFEECKRLGITVLPPDINKSSYNFSEEDENIRYGLLAIKGVGRVLVNSLIFERDENGDFKNIYDFCKRCAGRDLNRRSVEALIKAGCFDSLQYNRREMLESLDNILSNIQHKRNTNIDGQIDFFDSSSTNITIKKYDEFDKKTLQKQEKEVIGFYLSGNPLDEYKSIVVNNNFDNIADILNDDIKYSENRKVKILVNFENFKKKTTKNNDIMAFAEIADTTSACEMIIFPKTFALYNHMIIAEKPMVITGRISIKDDVSKQIICEKIEYIDDYINTKSLYLKVDSLSSIALKKALQIININKGASQVYVFCENTKKLIKLNKYKCRISEPLINTLKDILGENNVVKK